MFLALVLFLMQAEAVIDAGTIFAGEVLSLPAGDSRAKVSLGHAPAPGLARRISRNEIVSKLEAAGFAATGLEIPPTVLVRRRAASLEHDQVTRAILDAFTRQFPGANVEITSVDVPSLQIGTGEVELTATLPPRFDPAGTIFVKLEVRGSSFSRNVFVRTNVSIETEQPVLKNAIAAHAAVRPEDVELRPMAIRGEPIHRFEGILAKHDLPAGTALTADLFYTPVYVQKGEAVTVKAAAGAITISATMRAKASGKFGDTIQVEHMNGQGITTARIIGLRTLEALK